jgi:hypothetical protein
LSACDGVRVSSQIAHLVQRPDFDLARSRHGIGAALHPGDMSLTSQSQQPATSSRVAATVEAQGANGRFQRAVAPPTRGVFVLRSADRRTARPQAPGAQRESTTCTWQHWAPGQR